MNWLLAYGISNAIVVLPLAALAALVGRYSKRPALAHLLWVAVLVKFVTPPIVPVPLHQVAAVLAWANDQETARAESESIAELGCTPDEARAMESAGVSAVNVVKSTSKIRVERKLQRKATRSVSEWPELSRESLVQGLIGLWLVGAAMIVGRAAFQAWQFGRALKKNGRTDDWLASRLSKVASKAGLTSYPRLLVVPGTFSPMLWGVGSRSTLVFPGELAIRLDREACDSLLLHELAHYARGDHWIRLLELACRALFWWHPLVWVARKAIEASEELCCDAWVVTHQSGTPRSYAEAILATIDFLNEETPCMPPIASGLGEISLLRRRLTRIMLGEVSTELSPALKLAAVGCVVLVAPLGPALYAGSSSGERIDAPAPPSAAISVVRTASQPGLSPAARPQAPSGTGTSEGAIPRTSPGPTRLRVPADEWATAVSPSGKRKFEARGGLRTTLIDLANPTWRIDFTSHRITSLSFAQDDRFVTAQEGDLNVRIWDAAGGLLFKLEGADAEITSVAFSPSGTAVAAGTASGRVLVWDPESTELIAQLDLQNPVSCVRWSPEGSRVVISTAAWNQSDEAKVLVWNPAEAAAEAEFTLDRPISAVVWAADDTLAAIAWDGAGLMWNVSSSSILSQFNLGKDLPSAAAWSPDAALVRQWIDGVRSEKATAVSQLR